MKKVCEWLAVVVPLTLVSAPFASADSTLAKLPPVSVWVLAVISLLIGILARIRLNHPH